MIQSEDSIPLTTQLTITYDHEPVPSTSDHYRILLHGLSKYYSLP